MKQPRRMLFTLLLAVPLLAIPALLAAYYTFSADHSSMAGMPGMSGGAMPTATPISPANATDGGTRRVAVAGGSYGELSPRTLQAMLADRNFLLINVHVPYEGELAGTDDFIPYDRIAENTARLPADRQVPIVLYCRTGRMSAEAAATLVRLGYRDVRHLAGGMEAWAAQGYPLQGVPPR